MKKNMVTLIMIPMMVFGKWTISNHKYDELTGSGGYHSFSYGDSSKDGSGEVITYDSSDGQIKVICPAYSFFNSENLTLGEAMTKCFDEAIEKKYLPYDLMDTIREKRRENRSNFCVAKVGLYKNDKIKKRGTMIVELSDDKPEFGFLKETLFTGITSDEMERKYPTKNPKLHYLLKMFNLVMHEQYYYMQKLSSIKRTEIYDALSDTNMSVRIVIPRYGKVSNFDVTIKGDVLFTKIRWIPANRVREKLEQEKKEALKRAKTEEEAKNRERKKKEEKLARLEEAYKEKKRKYEICVKNGYTSTMKKRKSEMEEIAKEIAKIKDDIMEN